MPRWHEAGDQSCQPHGSRGWGFSEAGSDWIGLVWKWHQLDTFLPQTRVLLTFHQGLVTLAL